MNLYTITVPTTRQLELPRALGEAIASLAKYDKIAAIRVLRTYQHNEKDNDSLEFCKNAVETMLDKSPEYTANTKWLG